jgi:hypothetical protein
MQIILFNQKMQGSDFNLEATEEHKKVAFKEGYQAMAERLRQVSTGPTEESPASRAQVNMPKYIL